MSENDSLGDFGTGKSCLIKRYCESSKITARSIPMMERKYVNLEEMKEDQRMCEGSTELAKPFPMSLLCQSTNEIHYSIWPAARILCLHSKDKARTNRNELCNLYFCIIVIALA